MNTIITPDNKEIIAALTKPVGVLQLSGLTSRPGINPVKPTPVRSNIGVAALKYPPRIAHRVLPIAPERKPVFDPNSMPKTHGRKARILQWIAPGINGMGAVRRKPTPVIADAVATRVMILDEEYFFFIIDMECS